MESVFGLLDGSWVDMGSFVGAFLHACYNKAPDQAWICKQTGLDMANGVSIFPLMLLAGSVFSSQLLPVLISSNKLILAVAGAVALLAILERRPRLSS